MKNKFVYSFLSCWLLLSSLTAVASTVDFFRPSAKPVFLPGHNAYQDPAIVQISLETARLDERTFHFFSHGRPGQLLIQGRWADAREIAAFLTTNTNAAQFARINIYGCEFGKGEKGKTAVSFLENALGIRVAASDDITGKDGDWELEVGSPAPALSFPAYQGNLQCPYGSSTTNPSLSWVSNGNLDNYTSISENTANNTGGKLYSDGANVIYASSLGFQAGDVITIRGNYQNDARRGPLVLTSVGSGALNSGAIMENAFPGNAWGDVTYTIPVGTPDFSQLNITGATQNGVYVNIDIVTVSPRTVCYTCDINIAPSLSVTTISNICPATTFNLNSITASNTPEGAELTWHTATPATDANRIANPAAASATGTHFYAAFRSTANGCYSGLSGAATAMVLADADTDCDGVANSTDLDDDNDGVPDRSEINCPLREYLNLTKGLSGGANNMDTWLNAYGIRIRHINTTTFNANTTTFSVIGHGSWPDYNDSDNLMIYNGGGISISFYNADGVTKEAREYVALFSDPAPAGTVRVIARDISGNTILDRTDLDGQEHRVSLSQTGDVPIHELVLYNNSSAFDILSFSVPCQDIDTDNDGVPNRLDLDSDGDGCPDAVEAGVSSNAGAAGAMSSSGSVYSGGIAPGTANAYVGNGTTGQYGANGYFNGIETTTESGVYNGTSTYNPYAIGAGISSCANSDNDDVPDLRDIDDDNDGVLDAVESPGCYYKAAEFESGDRSAFVTVSSGVNMNASYNAPGELTDGISGTSTTSVAVAFAHAQTLDGANIFTFNFLLPVQLKNIYIGYINGNTHFLNTAIVKLKGSNDGTNWTDLNAGVSYGQTNTSGALINQGNKRYHVFPVTQNTASYKYYRIEGVSGQSWSGGNSDEAYFEVIDNYSASLNPKALCTEDIDNDGILNHHDLDTDGDGCPDTKEAVLYNHEHLSTDSGSVRNGSGGAVTSTETMPNAMMPAPYGTNGFADVLQSAADPNKYKYEYTYQFLATSAVNNLCLDSDEDGIPDFAADIDDDDDGVPNAIESPSCFFTLAQAIDITEDVTSDFEWSDTYPLSNTYDNSATAYGLVTPSIDILDKALITFQLPVITGAVLDTVKLSVGATAFGTGSWRLEGFNTSGVWEALSDGQAMNTINTTYNFVNSLKSDVAYHTYRIIGSTSASVTNNARLTEFDIIYKDFNPSAHPVKTGCVSDVDNDGMSNFLDRDSDGDGCPDAVEANVTGPLIPGEVFNAETGNVTIPNALADAPYGSNGLADGVETEEESGIINYLSTYNLYAIVLSVNACLDSDVDGVKNIADIDDDNDGIIDVAEKSCTTANAVKTGVTVTKPSTIDFVFDGTQTLADLVDGTDANDYIIRTPTGTLNNAEWFRVEFPSPKILTQWEIGHYSSQTLFFVGSTYRVEGSNDGTTWTALTGALSYNNTGSGQSTQANSNIANFPSNNTAYKYYRYFGISATSGGTWATEFYFTEKKCSDIDTDNDDIPNRLDLDSDGDGCPDAVEAGVSSNAGASASMSPSGSPYSGGIPSGTENAYVGTGDQAQYGSNGYFNGIEAGTESGLYNGTSTYDQYALANNWSLCADTDKDLKNDLVDLDDDNDGILDAVESPACYYTSTEATVISTVTSRLTSNDDQADGDIQNLHDANTATTNIIISGQALAGASIYTIKYPTAVNLTSLTLTGTTANWGAGSTAKLRGSNDGSTWTDLTEAQSTTSGNPKIFTVTTGAGNYLYYRIEGISTANSATISTQDISSVINTSDYMASAHPKPTCTADADGDGIANHHDLDTDGDGCSDAMEGGTNDGSDPITTSDLNHSGMAGGNSGMAYTGLAGPVDYNLGNMVDANGVPLVASGGQILGSAQNASSWMDNCEPPVPVAVADISNDNTPGSPATVNVTSNDKGGDPVDPATVDFVAPVDGTCEDTDTDGDCDKLTVTGEGIWTVTSAGLVTFTPETDFKKDPAPVTYMVMGNEGELSMAVAITADYVPVATNDGGSGETGTAVTVGVLANDIGGDTVDPATVQIGGTTNAGDQLVVEDEGGWSVNSTTGDITFTPDNDYTGNPTAITYTVKDAEGNTSNAAQVTVIYSPLPVTLIFFRAGEVPEGTKLVWRTADEKNFDRFEIEFSERPQAGFQRIATVQGGGSDYTYLDAERRTGIIYYRLKMIDLDGTYAYSRIVTITSRNGVELNKVYPNPSNGRVIHVGTNGQMESVKVFDTSGRSVRTQVTAKNGFYEIRLKKGQVPGIYVITYKAGGRQFSHQFVLSE